MYCREPIKDMKSTLKKVYGKDFQSNYTKMEKEGLCNEWQKPRSFFEWLLYENHEAIPYEGVPLKIDETKPWGPTNCRFGQRIIDLRNELEELYGIDFYHEYVRMKERYPDKLCEEWKDSRTFLEWIAYGDHDEIPYASWIGRKDIDEPWGPDNCVFYTEDKSHHACRKEKTRAINTEDAFLNDLIAGIKRKCGIDCNNVYYSMMRNHSREVCRSWKVRYNFVLWVKHNEDIIPYKGRFKRIDPEKNYSPCNCKFVELHKPEVKVRDAEFDGLKRKMKEIDEEIGINFTLMYSRNVSRKVFDPDVWSQKDFYQYISDLYDAGRLQYGLHIHKIAGDKPFSSSNAYFSFRKEGRKGHGMSYTRIYHMYMWWKRYYRDRLKSDVTLEQFIEYALKHEYEEHNGIRTDGKGKDEITLDNVSFPDNGFYDDIRRITAVYATIPAEEDGFGSRSEFVRWSILSGYTEEQDFRKVAPGKYSPETCVWDLFTTEGFLAHNHKVLQYIESTDCSKQTPAYKRRANWKQNGGICEEWKDINVFNAWWDPLQKEGLTMCAYRKDATKPYSPDNVVISYKEPVEKDVYAIKYASICKDKSAGVSSSWDTLEKFKNWCIKNGVTDCFRISRIDADKPYGPKNVKIFRYREKKTA